MAVTPFRNNPGIFALLISRFTLRHWRQSWKETFALLLLLAVGVGAYLSIRLANRASLTSFEGFVQTLTGETDVILRSASGRLTEEDLTAVWQRRGDRPVHLIPVLETIAALPSDSAAPISSDNWIQLVGIDLIHIQNLPAFQQRESRLIFQNPEDSGDQSVFEALQRPGAAFVHPQWANEKGLAAGDCFELYIQDRAVQLSIAGFLPQDPRLPQPSSLMMILDIGELQKLADLGGELTRIEILTEPGAHRESLRSGIRAWLTADAPAHWIVESPQDRRERSATMTRAFRLNLTILSLIALVVSLYLIIQALEAAVVRRRPEIATLRSLGIDQKTLLRAWLAEAFLLGLAGSLLGILIGWAGAQLSVRGVAQTVNALYQATSVKAAGLTFADFWVGLLLGTGAATLAGWIPAREAARTPPAQILVRGYVDPGLPLLQRADLGVLLLIVGTLFCWFPPLSLGAGVRFPLLGYLAALFWMFGASLVLPLLLRGLAGLLLPLLRRAPTAFLACSRLRRPSGRHKLAAAGLLIAIGMANGMSILIGSFEFTMQNWIRHTLQADLYITSKANQTASSEARIDLQRAEALADRPEVTEAEFFRGHRITLDGLDTLLGGIDLESAIASGQFRFLKSAQNPASASDGLPPAIISESFANRFGKHVGDSVILPFPESGNREVRITGIYADYGNERGALLLNEDSVRKGYGDDAVTSIAINLVPDTDPENLRLAWSNEFPALQIQTNRSLRNEVLRIFRQTFSITYALKAIALAVALGGLALGLVGLLLEYRPDLLTLRALGMRRREMARVTAWEGAGLTFVALLGGTLLSFALGILLIYVINRQSFGWTLAFAIPWSEMIFFSGLVLCCGILVSWILGFWGARLPADREE